MGRRIVRLGIIGCGLIGRKRAAAARGQVKAVADINLDLARSLGAASGAEVVTEDWRHLLDCDLDAVVVATRHDALASIAQAFVEAGRHVLVEKPAGRTAAEIRPIAEASRRTGVVVKVGYNHRFHPGLLKAKEIVDSGALGPLMVIRGRYGHGARLGYDQEWRCDKPVSGGGELIDQGSHLIDLSHWFLGALRLDYAATPTFYWNTEVDDNCFLALRAANGAMAWLHAGWTEWKNIFSFEIAGRDGKLQVDGLGGSYGVETLTHYRMLPELGPPETTAWQYPFPDRSWDLEFADFAEAIATGRRANGDIEDALEAAVLIDAAYAWGDA